MKNYILKVTNGCNMRCRYCCVGDKTEYSIISKECLYESLKFAVQNTKAHNDNTADIIFHGGEPTLLNCEIYEEVISSITAEYPEIRFNWKMQTNGLILNDSFINLFIKYRFCIGVSIDGSAKNHDSVRTDISGNATFERVKSNIIRLKENGISVSSLMVVTSESEKDYSFLNWFQNNDIPLKINPLLECGEAVNEKSLSLKPGEYADYLINVFEYSINHNFTIDIQPFNGLFNRIVSKSGRCDCTFSENCFKNFMAIDYNGNIYPCGRFCDSHRFSAGNISSVSVPFSISKNFDIKMKNGLNENKCSECRFFKICHGGCKFITWINEGNGNPLCYDYQKIFEYIITDSISLIESKLIKRRESLKNEIIRKNEI